MKIPTISGALLALSCLTIFADDKPAAPAAPPAAPARTRMTSPASTPELLPDGRVTFRFRGKGQQVVAAGQFGPTVTLEKAGDLWTGTTAEPVKPGVYEYHLTVDGLNVIDALNPAIKPQRWPGSSILHVPANPPALWDLQDIPHGTVHHHTYRSEALGKWRDLVVYTPPGYENAAAAAAPLPVLYLAHGFSDNQGTWTVHGKAHWILDALISQKAAVPMVIVMPDAHALPPGEGWKDDYGKANTDAFCKELTQDVIPFTEKTYRVRKEPGSRAFAGLSMGGRHALTVGLTLSDTFAWIGAFSSAPPDEPTMAAATKDVAGLNGRLKLFWVACGKADFLFARNQEVHAAFEKAGIKHDYVVSEGDHSWPIWRNYLSQLAPKLFR